MEAMDTGSSAAARADGRDEVQLRALGCELGLLHRADGSAKFSQGHTCVLASVYGPMEVPLRLERADRATLQVVVKPKVGLPGIAERRMEGLILHVMNQVVLTTLHPRSLISITLQTLCDDGSLLSCAINAACLALLDAGVALRTCVAAATCSVAVGGGVALDPLLEEEKTSSSSFTFAFLKDPAEQSALSHTVGAFSEEQYAEAWGLSAAAASKIILFLRKSMERRLSKEMNVRVRSTKE